MAKRKKSKKKKLKKQKKTEKKGNLKLYFGLAALAIVAGGVYLSSGSEEVIEGTPSMAISSQSYDFGRVSVSGGVVTTSFLIQNRGQGDLVIEDMDTSCGCTSASIIYRGEEGPKFNMREHGTNPSRWSQRIHPGEEAYLKVYYNPRVHADLRGEVIRVVNLYTNDPAKPVVKVKVRVVQVA